MSTKGKGVQFLHFLLLGLLVLTKFKAHTHIHEYIHDVVPELSALSEGGGVISLEGDREWRPTREERGGARGAGKEGGGGGGGGGLGINDCVETLHSCYGNLQKFIK